LTLRRGGNVHIQAIAWSPANAEDASKAYQREDCSVSR